MDKERNGHGRGKLSPSTHPNIIVLHTFRPRFQTAVPGLLLFYCSTQVTHNRVSTKGHKYYPSLVLWFLYNVVHTVLVFFDRAIASGFTIQYVLSCTACHMEGLHTWDVFLFHTQSPRARKTGSVAGTTAGATKNQRDAHWRWKTLPQYIRKHM